MNHFALSKPLMTSVNHFEWHAGDIKRMLLEMLKMEKSINNDIVSLYGFTITNPRHSNILLWTPKMFWHILISSFSNNPSKNDVRGCYHWQWNHYQSPAKFISMIDPKMHFHVFIFLNIIFTPTLFNSHQSGKNIWKNRSIPMITIINEEISSAKPGIANSVKHIP